VIDWTPTPNHTLINTICFKTWGYDGGLDVHSSFSLSGEPPSAQIARGFGKEPTKQFSASEIAAVNIQKREAQKDYMEFWNEKGVDGVISPLAPFPAARPGKYDYYGYTTWVNLLDYTSVVLPVTNVKKDLDPVDTGYEPRNEVDKSCYESCELFLISLCWSIAFADSEFCDR
jgi:amidase